MITLLIQVVKSNRAAQKMKFPIKDFFSKCDQVRRKLRIWSHLLKKSLMETSFFVHCRYANCHFTIKYFCYLRYVSRTKLEQKTRRKYTTIYECCSGYRQEGHECPIGEANHCADCLKHSS